MHSPKPAYPYRVSGFIVHVAALLFFLVEACKHRLASALAGATSHRSSAHACRFLSSGCDPTRENTSRQEPLSVIAGRVSGESRAPLKVSGQKLPVQAPTSSSTLLWASLSECARAFFLRDYRSRRTDQIVARRFESLSPSTQRIRVLTD